MQKETISVTKSPKIYQDLNWYEGVNNKQISEDIFSLFLCSKIVSPEFNLNANGF